MYTSRAGGAHIRLHVKGFSADLKDEILYILFRDLAGSIVYRKRFGKQSSHSDENDVWLTSGSSFATFVAPPLTTVTGESFHPHTVANHAYDMALIVKHFDEIVSCHVVNRCQLIY